MLSRWLVKFRWHICCHIWHLFLFILSSVCETLYSEFCVEMYLLVATWETFPVWRHWEERAYSSVQWTLNVSYVWLLLILKFHWELDCPCSSKLKYCLNLRLVWFCRYGPIWPIYSQVREEWWWMQSTYGMVAQSQSQSIDWTSFTINTIFQHLQSDQNFRSLCVPFQASVMRRKIRAT